MFTVARGTIDSSEAADSDAASEPFRFSQIRGFQVNSSVYELKTKANLRFYQPIEGS